jgi:hypothetical protein
MIIVGTILLVVVCLGIGYLSGHLHGWHDGWNQGYEDRGLH